jgi:diguanylate cyclase (GGDEF)-like protein/PAS domain S-box-containing protein
VSLKANTYVALIGCAFLAIAVLFSATIYAGRGWIHAAERYEAADAMREVNRAIDVEIQALDVSAHDWSAWDDVYDYVVSRDPEFHEASLADASYLEMGLASDALVIVNLQGDVVDELIGRKFSRDETAVAELHRLILGPHGLAERANETSSGLVGVLRAGDQAMIFAARPIINSEETAPSRGAFVLARAITPSVLARLGSVPDVPLTLHPAENPGLAAATIAALSSGDASAPPLVEITRPLDITAYLLVRDYTGRVAAYLTSRRPAFTYDTSMRALTGLLGVFLLGGMIWAVAAFMLIDRTSLRRIVELRDAVTEIGAQGDLSARIPIDETALSDETAIVATSVNSMLAALEESRRNAETTETHHKVLVETMSDAVFTMTPDRRFSFVNDRAVTLIGIDRDALIGTDYLQLVKKESRAAIDDALDTIDAGGPGSMLDVEMIRRDGLPFPAELSISPVRDGSGQLAAIHWIARDVTERRHFEDQLLHLASHDHLTGLLNRRRFEEEASRVLASARRTGTEVALLWIDIDRFKQINDTYNHRIGDAVLIGVANALNTQVREADVFCRLGGDEFALLLPQGSEHAALQTAERILAELAQTAIVAGGQTIQVSASIGAALFPKHAANIQELLTCTDVAMYEAKKGGRNRVYMFSADDDWPRALDVHREWGTRIEAALASGTMVAFAQPILDLRTGAFSGFELLVRMRDDDGGIIEPGEFLPAAEHLGLVTQIDRWMVRKAAELLTAPTTAPNVKLHVNLSGKTISDAGFPGFVHSTLVDTGSDAHRLAFELTETALVSNMSRARDFIETLRQIGCTFALDDFGSGFSSLSYLRRMPVDVLKIDGSLVRGIPDSEQDRSLVRAIADLARCLSIPVTAEYVESEEVLAFLREIDIDTVQGNYIGAASPAEGVVTATGPDGWDGDSR